MFTPIYVSARSLQEIVVRNKSREASSATVGPRLSGRLLHVATEPEGHHQCSTQAAGTYLPILAIITVR
jgi:hypothetical protein